VNELNHHIIVVGGGGAGLRAAIAMADDNPQLSIALVSKVYPMRSHTVAAEGGAAAVIGQDDQLEDHVIDTISGSDWLADQDAVEVFAKEAPLELAQLEHWGCPWSRDENGQVSVRPFGGMKKERTWYAADKTGFHLLHTLYQTALKYENIHHYNEWLVTSLIVESGRCQGVIGLEIRSGTVAAISAPSVILATGGYGRIFAFTTNGSITNGDGLALAMRAGVTLKDMEFVQFHPTSLPGTGTLISEAARGEGGILVNKENCRYLQDYDLGLPLDHKDPTSGHPRKSTMELGPRDRLTQAFVLEKNKGRTFSGPYGDYVHLDLRHLGKKKINERLPSVAELAIRYIGINPLDQPIPVRPAVHYTMGGIKTNIQGETSLPGLFAAGECACVSINGANRLGSNSLTELLVFGKRAAHSAVEYALNSPRPNPDLAKQWANKEHDRILRSFILKDDGGETVSRLRRELNQAMEDGSGIFRTEKSLRTAKNLVDQLRQRYCNLQLDDQSLKFNTELVAALDLGFMLDCGRAVIASALERRESRGSHQRLDYPKRDDDQFLRHTLATLVDDQVKIEFDDVFISHWPPAERVYGR